jgi:hypothetical protein
MARKIIDIGAVGNDGTGDSIRDSFRKVNDNFRELYSSLGLGERLTFIALDDTPTSFSGQNDPITGNTPLLTVNNTESGVAFKQLLAGNGMSIDFTTNPDQIVINSVFAAVVGDDAPQLGGDLNVASSGNTYRIYNLDTPTGSTDAANKAYVDTKVSLRGVEALDPSTGTTNSAFGRMGGPLILSRSPEPGDDELYDGLIAATKSYVDNAAFGSVANLYVATSGSDERPGVSKSLQGRALAYAYRTIEAACRRAEELVLEARQEIGPYKKVLTYNNGVGTCTLTSITTSPVSGTGFAGTVRMSVDTVTINNVGTNYFAGDILTISGGTPTAVGSRATIQILSVSSIPGQAYGPILTYKIISSGSYTALPGATAVATTISTSAAPVAIGAIGAGATFNITYKVNSAFISNPGSGYSLVSVRITGGGGAGAFGTGVVSAGLVTSITITDAGSGFTSLPTLTVDLPRFAIQTNNYRTDFTGDVITDTPEAYRGRDIREGLFLRGETSGALAQILGHSGELDSSGNELFDVDIKYGAFQLNEVIAYGDVTKNIQITILVESGIYEENYPIKVPQNTSIVGDEFRRCIIRPAPGTSSSPWAFNKFRRDLTIDGLTTATQEFGYHYLQDSSQPVYPKIQNKGYYTSAAALLDLNRTFIQEEMIAWINRQIANNTAPFSSSFVYNSSICKRDAGLIIDALVFDLKWGGYNRTISAGLKYFQNVSGRIAITTQLSQTLAAITKVNTLAISCIANSAVSPLYQTTYTQIVDLAYQSETGADTVLNSLIAALKDVMDSSGSVNYPKDNEDMDVFLANDAVRWQAITAQGHGGFMCVLDPAGQILAKSPYAQECASFSRSIDAQTFAGGLFVDGFTGNLQFTMTTIVSPIRIQVSNLDRFPNLPCSFIVADSVYRVNYVRDFVYDKDGSTATFILDETTPWPYALFTYNESICNRDVGLIVDGLGYDIVFGTNFNQRKAGLVYREANAAVVISDQRDITIRAIELAHTQARAAVSGSVAAQAVVDSSEATIVDIIDRGIIAAPTLSFTLPPGISSNLTNAYTLLYSNIEYIKAEVIGWIAAQVSGNIAPFTTSYTYNESQFSRTFGYILEAVIYDLIYGGNSQSRDAGLKYYDGVGDAITLQIPAGQVAKEAAAITYANTITQRIIQNLAPVASYSTLTRITGSAATATEAATVNTLMSNIATTISSGVGSAPALTLPNISAYSYTAGLVTARTALVSAKSSIQTAVISYINTTGNQYELLMPGNRSMLSNDYTQINDMGYGAIAHNGGLIELVSMFTYYCYISYYSINGGQIRSVGGSSAHGIYALVAEGSDPLEVPTPTSVFEDFAQKCKCYAPSPTYFNSANGLFIYVYAYDYTPFGASELEIDHSGAIYRYAVTSVTTTDLPTGVARLNLSTGATSGSDGLFAQVNNDVKMTLRINGQILLTGQLADVAVRPSTGLKLRETNDNVYRVLQFSNYTDSNGPYEVIISNASPTVLSVLATITTIATNLCTTSQNHKLKVGDKFIPRSTANGLTSGTTYYVTSVPEYNQFYLSTAPGGTTATLTNGTGLTIKGRKTHKLSENYTISFDTTGTLPTGITPGITYYVAASNLTDTEFQITETKNGTSVNTSSAGSGTHRYSMEGLTRTNLRENYNYLDLTVWQPGEFKTSGATCTISIASPAVITLASHGFVAGDVVKFETTGALPIGLSVSNNYFVLSAGLASGSFRVSLTPGGTAADTSGSQSGVHTVGKVTGRAGDTTFAVVGLGSQDVPRADGSKFVFLGEEYIISDYQSEAVTNKPYARVVLNKPLVDSIVSYGSSYTIKAAVPIRTSGALGNLTIRISLTRVTSHDLLEIGTGSYADTNYPSEIYGPSVNPINADTETEERDVGRVFYVTTDQYGNFSVGPYFRVDQGTGTVTFSSSIALSNLDGIGFKRGVPVSEFSTDSGFTDNATDTVPTENATRIYIERRLGVTHDGSAVTSSSLIPLTTGGFMPLSGLLSMKGTMDLGNNKIVNLTNATNPQDAVNLRSLTWNNFQDFTGRNIQANDLLVFTGSGNQAFNAAIVGDISLNIDSTANTLDAQINPGVIVNADINASAGIDQTKLTLDNTYATTASGFTGVTASGNGTTATLSFSSSSSTPPYVAGQRIIVSGLSVAGYNGTWTVASCTTSNVTFSSTITGVASGGTMRPLKGIASFDTTQFTVTDGWVTVKANGVTINRIEQISSYTVLGNSTLSTGSVSQVTFSSVVDLGAGVKKSQYSSTGFLRRTNAVSNTADGDYSVVEAATGTAAAPEASKIVIRDSNGDFGARIIDLSQLKIDANVGIDTSTTATGGFIRYYGYNTVGGILIQSGSLAADAKTAYWNDAHNFKTKDGLSDAPITASSIQVGVITTGGNTTPGTITGRWTLTGTSPNESRLQATYSADLAENYEGDKDYEVGTVLVFGGDKEVTTTNVKNDTRVAGVVSNTAAFTMYEACPGLKNLVALQGRVPCKVVGKIKKGDILVTSGIPGVAMAAVGDVKVGTVVGKALKDYDSDHIGTLEIAVGRT